MTGSTEDYLPEYKNLGRAPDIDDLLIGDHPVRRDTAILESASNLQRGTVLVLNADGKVSAWNGKFEEGGSKIDPIYILANPANIEDREGPLECVFYMTGQFNINKIIYPQESDLIQLKANLHQHGIYLEKSQKPYLASDYNRG